MTLLQLSSVVAALLSGLTGSPSRALYAREGALLRPVSGYKTTVQRSSRHSTTATAERESCLRFVRSFYAWYAATGKDRDPLSVALKRRRSHFSRELIRGLEQDAEAAAKSPNEIVGLDFDPVLNSQDFADKYAAGEVVRKSDRWLVAVFSVYSGKKGVGPAVTPELRHERGRWVFTYFHYRNDGKSDDLLSLLKRLKADRKKSPPART